MIIYPTQPETWYRPIPPTYAELLAIARGLERRVAVLEKTQSQPQPANTPQSDADLILYLQA